MVIEPQWLKWFCEAGGGAHLTKPGWSKPHTHSNPTNFALLVGLEWVWGLLQPGFVNKPTRSLFYRPDALPVAQPTVSQQRRGIFLIYCEHSAITTMLHCRDGLKEKAIKHGNVTGYHII